MKDYFKPKTWLITILMFMIAFGLSLAMVYYEFGFKKNIKITSAAPLCSLGESTSYAWNSNIGWISFNCNNNPGECAISNYKVNVNSATKDFSGYAWSPNVGWISFNRSNTGDPPDSPYKTVGPIARFNTSTGRVDGWAKILSFKDICVGGTNPGTLCPIGNECIGGGSCQSNGWIKLSKFSSDSGSDYAVSIDPTTGIFSGWAWNSNADGSGIGWISFNCSNVIKVCNGGTNTGALCSVANDCPGGGCTDTQNSCQGGAKAGMPCAVAGHCPGGSCVNTCTALSDFKVVSSANDPPTVEDMKAPNWNYLQASANALRANLQFSYVSPNACYFGSAYQIILKQGITTVLDTGICTGYLTPSPNCKIDISCMKNVDTGCGKVCVGGTNAGALCSAASDCPGGSCVANCTCQFPLAAELNYATAYKWSVKGWDDHGMVSGLTNYSTNPDSPTEADDQPPNNNNTFTTYKHEFPIPGSTPFPAEPSRGEKVKFTDQSQRFFSLGNYPFNPAIPVACTSSACRWEWSVDLASMTIDDTATSTPTIIFNKAGANTVTLKVYDQGDTGNVPYYSIKNINININAKLPKWKEVKPE